MNAGVASRPPFRTAPIVASSLFVLAVFACNRDVAPAALDEPDVVVFGESGAGPVEFNYPRAVAWRPSGALVIIDKAGRVQMVTPDGVFIRDWMMPEYADGRPVGLDVHPDGSIWIADTHYYRIVRFSPEGEVLGMFGKRGHGPGEFGLLSDVAIRPDGGFYVGEFTINDRISAFDADGAILRVFGDSDDGDAAVARPQALLIAPDGTLWVADACNHRICHFSAEGALLGAFGVLGAEPGQLAYPYGLGMLQDGSLVVCEYGNNRVQRFTQSGESLGTWGAAGRAVGRLAYPWSLAVLPDDRVAVLDSGNDRVQIFDGADPANWRRSAGP